MRVLIAFPLRDDALAEEIEEQLKLQAKVRGLPEPLAHIVHNATRGWSFAQQEDVTHCLVHEDLPPDRHSAPAAGLGMQFATGFRQRRPHTPITLFYTSQGGVDRDVNRLVALGAEAVRNSEAGIASLVERILAGMALPDHQPLVDITIDLSKSEYRISSKRVPQQAQTGVVRLKPYELNNYLMLSKRFEEHEDWHALGLLKESLCGSLIHGNEVFYGALTAALSDAHLANNACVHFRINQEQYDVAFEAIAHPHDKTFWMLHAPVFRSIAGGVATLAAEPLFHRPESPLNCLLILSAASGLCALSNATDRIGLFHRYDALPHAQPEFQALHARFQALRSTGRVGRVDVIGDTAPLTLSALTGKFSNQRWDVVHYIGHTDYLDDRALVILPGDRPDEAQAVGLELIAPFLAQTSFVYLSSCQGTKLAFVRQLAEHGVPSVLGFRTRIRDDLAAEHAQYFYDRLFALSSLERAFFSTRKHFHERYPKERLWACASLVLQR